MKINFWLLAIVLMVVGCKKSPTTTPPPGEEEWDGVVRPAAPLAVSKSSTKKVFVHLMPWFETKASNGSWGIHWTMAKGSTYPETIVSGRRRIASHYYPMIGPYASGDTSVIDYQLLLMKLSGVDGLLIDWPGTGTNLGENMDLPLTAANTKKLVSRLSKVGLKYALVYEDQYVGRYTDKESAAGVDLKYAETNYFNDPAYEKIGDKPLLMVFGPQAIKTGTGWANVFSKLSKAPAFFTLWGQRNQASGTTTGEYAWIDQSNITRLNNFYSLSYNPGTKVSSVYPGFKSFYAEGGWPGPTWIIDPVGTSTYEQTLNLALAQNIEYLQIATWNDYGEGTMIEPTDAANGGYGYSLLTILQQKLGVSLTQSDLEAVTKFYQVRIANGGNSPVLNKLNQVYYYMVSLQMDKAKKLLATI
ncbi:MAG: glycoside hydrolase family 71/99-like protein [Ferruginibacter sp.]